MHGPGPWTETNRLGWEPEYPFPLPIIDDVVATVSKKWSWRRSRTLALGKWQAAGLTFEVTEGPGQEYTAAEPWLHGGVATPYIHVGGIRLLRGSGSTPSFGFYTTIYSSQTGEKIGSGGIAVYHPGTLTDEELRWYNRRTIAAHVAHEVGHCLGLWHRDKAIMGGGYNPDAHDLESLNTYYLGG